MPGYLPHASVELFHLMLLDLLGRRIDRRGYALKGGCNLRFFMNSPRYSEDMDIDVGAIPVQKLSDAMSGILDGDTLTQLLSLRGIRLQRYSAPKQTATTQRWKMTLSVEGSGVPVPTKVEFSRRGMQDGVVFGAIGAGVARTYGMSPLMVSHYGTEAACRQKVEALATRRETQARDVFDLFLLVASGTDTRGAAGNVRSLAARAAANAISVGFEVFRGQVLSFIHPELRAQYDSAEAWDHMVLTVVRCLEEAMR